MRVQRIGTSITVAALGLAEGIKNLRLASAQADLLPAGPLWRVVAAGWLAVLVSGSSMLTGAGMWVLGRMF